MDNGQLLHRQARDADASGSQSESDESDSCVRLYACSLPHHRYLYSESILSSFHFDQVPGVLSQVCSESPNTATCDPQGCDNANLIQFSAAHLNRVWDWICGNSAGFQTGMACWSETLKIGLERCSTRYRGRRHHRRYFINCSVRVAQSLGDTCTANDIAFLQSLLRQVMYPA